MKLLCFGDSNTYGFDPRSPLGGRYKAADRWVERLAAKTGWAVQNFGENGREIPLSAPDIPPDTDLMILMLGTNDLLQGRSPQQAAARLETFAAALPLAPARVLLVAPPPLARGAWVPDESLVDASRAFGRLCRDVAGRLGTRFADAGQWGIPLAYDGVHFTEQGHRAFADQLLEVLR